MNKPIEDENDLAVLKNRHAEIDDEIKKLNNQVPSDDRDLKVSQLKRQKIPLKDRIVALEPE